MKTIVYILGIIVLAVIVLAAAFYFLAKKAGYRMQDFISSQGIVIKIKDEKTKLFLKGAAIWLDEKLNNAHRKYDPPGDLVPDSWDDKIKGLVKEKIN